MIKVSVIGATGYVGTELVRNLLNHPKAEIIQLISKTYAGEKFSDVYPNIANCKIVLTQLDIKSIAKESDVVFCALPHGLSAEVCAQLLAYDVKVIDLSGDLRYDDSKIYEKWYNVKHQHIDVMNDAVYGLCELNEELIKKATIVANPGCYTTCSILALYPLLKEDLIIDHGIIIDAKSGATGAGRNAKTPLLFSEVDENIKAYKVTTHQHTSEIEQELSKASGTSIVLTFTPHLVPMKRGILATSYAQLKPGVTNEDIDNAYNKYYENKSFVNFTGHKLPETKMVCGSNRIDIGYKTNLRTGGIIIVSVIDNLIKGAGGSAIQNMNIMFNLDQTTGLQINGSYL